MTPSAGAPGREGRRAPAGQAPGQTPRPIRLACPQCGRIVTVYEDEVGQAGKCAGCGAEITVRADAFSETVIDPDMTVADTAAGVGSPDVMAESASPPAAPAQPKAARRSSADDTAELPVPQALAGGGVDYAIWQGVVSGAGDWAMAARLQALHKAEQAHQAGKLGLAGEGIATALQMVLCEAAVAAFQTQSEADWRKDWTRRLVRIAARWPDEASVDGVVAVLGQADTVIAELKAAGVWPWRTEPAEGS